MLAPQLIPHKTVGDYTIYERKPKPFKASKYVVLKKDQPECDGKDCGKMSVAVRWAKSQEPRQLPKVCIIIRHGAVQGVISSVPVRYLVLDGDVMDEDFPAIPAELFEGGRPVPGSLPIHCTHTEDLSHVNHQRIEEIEHAIELHEEQKKATT